ncbi:MAG: LacI family DNA-binding transcriptional regulator [Chloroflexi bacterium]|nr:LacI family DNA-binding transcriptional regulator [Chloroflexota bacterium]
MIRKFPALFHEKYVSGFFLTCFSKSDKVVSDICWLRVQVMGDSIQRQKGQTTIRDIAREADVSISTVSRVLNDHPHVDSLTRQAVWKTATELDYPFSRLRGQTSKQGRTMAFLSSSVEQHAQVLPALSGGIEQLIVRGAQSVFEDRRVSTHIYKALADVEHMVDVVEAYHISGVIFLGGVFDHALLRKLQAQSIPFVTAGGHAHPLDGNAVMANYVQGMVYAIGHLKARGRRHICLVNGPETTNTSREKYWGYRLALGLNDLQYKTYQTTRGTNFNVESGFVATSELLGLHKPVDAIIYADDGMAVGGLKAIRESGRKAPDDIAVIGFHNYDFARFADPALTTIGFDMQMMGRLAALRLCNLMDGAKDDPHVMTVSTKLIVRDST